MVKFTTETEGLDTFRICEITSGTQLDTVGLGMLLNNEIQGLAPISQVRNDNKEFIRYNISSQITLKQLFMEKADKKRFLTVLKNILTTVEDLDEYMLEPSMLLLDKEEIYINVATLQTELLYYPIVENREPFQVKNFVRNLLMSMEFDSTENSSYVTLLINFLNHPTEISVAELRKYIVELLQDTQQNQNTFAMNTSQNCKPVNPPMMNQPPMGQPMMNQPPMGQPMMNQPPMGQPMMNQPPIGQPMMNQPPIGQPMMSQAPMGQPMMNQPPIGQPMMQQAPMGQAMMNQTSAAGNFGGEVLQESKKKKGFSLFTKEPRVKKEKVKKEKTTKAEKKAAKKGKSMEAPPAIPTNLSASDNMAQSMNIPPMPTQAGDVSIPPISKPSKDIPPIVSADGDFGQTVVLSTDTSGETTVLNVGYNTVQKKSNPYLIRKRTNEKIEITKDFFKIGKERSYVDYWISDNSAISRSHADIIKQNQEFFIIDNNSLNHTFIGGQQIPSQQMTKLEDFMMITLADEVFEFHL